MKQKYYFISLVVVIFALLFTAGNFVNANAQIDNEGETSTISSEVKPKIDLTYLGVIPSNPMVGQEVTVRYKLTPHPFQHNVSKSKEIVLVLDGSGSMSGSKLTNLKKAAKEFITRLSEVDNLKIGIVVYSSEATINPNKVNGTKKSKSLDSSGYHQIPNYSSTVGATLLDVGDNRLMTMIDNITALGGTNTGEGLRKAEYLLQQGDPEANKTLILMSDGLPTFYSVKKTNNTYTEYTNIDSTNPSYKGSGSENNSSNVTKSTNYSTTIGEIIAKNNYNIFSIGYGLGNSTSTANKKLQEIHTSMGGITEGEDSTFFASDTGAIESVFNKIADTLQKTYAFNDAQLNLDLPSSVTLLSDTSNVNGIKINPIVYQLGENNWYHAEEQIIEFKMKIDKSGEVKLFNDNTSFSYTDIYGNLQIIPINSPIINVLPFDVDASQKLQIDFQPSSNGYLIGDMVKATVTVLHPNINNIIFNEMKFVLNSLPSNLILEDETDTLNFGQVSNTVNNSYQIKIEDDQEITADQEKVYQLIGNYSYKIKQGTSIKTENGTDSTQIAVKRGQIRVKVIDENKTNISEYVKMSIKGKEYTASYRNGYIIFDTIPSGNYELVIEELPEGITIDDENKNAKVMINYDQNIAEYEFQVQGSYEDALTPNLNVELTHINPSIVNNDQELNITYTIHPQEFDGVFSSSDSQLNKIAEAMFIVDASKSMLKNSSSNAIVNGITNLITNNDKIIDEKFKLGIIGYNSDVVYPSNEQNIRLYSMSDNDDKEIFRKILEEGNLFTNLNSSDRNISQALIKADEILSSSETTDKKAIIIISTDNIAVDQSTIKLIKSKGYKIISFHLGSEGEGGLDSYTLKELHQQLGGGDDYFETPYEEGNYNFANQEMAEIREALLTEFNASTANSVTVSPILNFDLGEHFLPVEGLTLNEGNQYKISVPDITYHPTTQNQDGTYRYEADSIKVSFKVKVNTDQLGSITFDNIEDKTYNNITYEQFNGTMISKLIETPKVEVVATPLEIEHGLYGGISKDGINIIPSLTEDETLKEIVGTSTINFAATFTFQPYYKQFSLITDSKLGLKKENIKLYQVKGDEGDISLIPIDDVDMYVAEFSNEKTILMNLYSKVEPGTKILVHYSIQSPTVDSITYTNCLQVDDKREPVQIRIIKTDKEDSKINLPFLF